MPLDIPTIDEVVNRSKTDVQRQVGGGIDPFSKNNVVTAITVANANRVFDFYTQLQAALLESLPDTADSLLDRWAAIFGVTLLAATKATGNVIATGTAVPVTVPINTVFVATNGQTYTSTASVNFDQNTVATAALVRQTNVTTVTTDGPHGFSTNTVVVGISGVTPSSFNVSSPTITVISATEFSYDNTGVNESATVQGTVTFQQASVPVEADEFGKVGNLAFGTQLTLQSPIVNINNTVVVDTGELAGGTDQESKDDSRTRLLTRIQNPVAHFNPADIENKIKEINGVTRVFVFPLLDPNTQTPATDGTVSVYFMRDNDADPIPTAPEVAAAQAKLNEIRPANTAATDAQVLAPTAVVQNFIINGLTPDTPTMEAAVEANLQAFFAEKTEVGVDVLKVAYDSAIFNTVDPETGSVVISFTVTTPAGAISITTGEIAVLGTVTFT